MILCLRNRQRVCPLDLRLFRRILRSVLEVGTPLRRRPFSDSESDSRARMPAERRPYRAEDPQLCFHFVEAKEMARINERFLDHVGPTDVITFDQSEGEDKLHGEIFICPEVAVKQAREFRTTWQSELVRYAIHGVLHLTGYDDRKSADRRRMKREEERLLKETERHFAVARLALWSPETRSRSRRVGRPYPRRASQLEVGARRRSRPPSNDYG